MRNLLLTTTTLAMTASFAAADGLSMSGSAGAGVWTNEAATSTEVWSGIDINISASVTTDSGMTFTVGDDFGGGQLIDWDDDYAVDTMGTTIGTPGVTITSGDTSISLDNQAKDDLYDDGNSGDIQVSTILGGASITAVLDTDAAAAVADDAATAAVDESVPAKPSFSYSVSLPLGGFAVTATGTDANPATGVAANVLKASYTMDAMTVTISTDDKGAGDSVNKLAVSTNLSGAALSFSADDNDDWDLGIGYTEGSITLNLATDENSAWETNVKVDLGSGAAFRVSAKDSDDWMAAGVTFSF